jgi:hypothetical protein
MTITINRDEGKVCFCNEVITNSLASLSPIKLANFELIVQILCEQFDTKEDDTHEAKELNETIQVQEINQTMIIDYFDELSRKIMNENESIKTSIPMVIQYSMRDLEREMRNTTTTLFKIQEQLLSTKVNQSTKDKGAIGENKLYELLTENLKMREGYHIEQVNGISCSCDIVVRRLNFPTVRIESKTYTNEKVRYKEVEKFIRDLQQTNDHGIFVSLHTDIVGISNFEVQQLSNGKFAIYLTKNNFDIECIISMIHLIYKITDLTSSNDDMITISPEVLNTIQSHLKDYNNKLTTVKNHMRESTRLLSEVQLDIVEKMLMTSSSVNPSKETLSCTKCNKPYKSLAALKKHIEKCT